MNDEPIDLQAERIKRLPTRPFVMVQPGARCPVQLVDLYRDGRDLQRVGMIYSTAGNGIGLTADHARELAAALLVAADALDARRADGSDT